MRREPEARAKELPGRAGAIIGAPFESLHMTGQSLGELAWQSRERQPIAPVGPQQIAARPAAPRGDVSTPNCRPGARTLAVEQKDIVGAGFYAELWRPAVPKRGEFRTEPAADALGAWNENPRSVTVALQLPLGNGRRRGLGSECRSRHLCARRIGSGGNQRPGIDSRAARVRHRFRQRAGALDARGVRQSPPERLAVAAGREVCPDQQPDDAAGPRQLERTLRERHGEIGEMREPARPGWPPAGVARRKNLAHAWRQPLRAHPRRVARHDVEPALQHDVREVRFERKERRRAILPQPPLRTAQVAQRLPQPAQAHPLLMVEPAAPAKQIAIARHAEQLVDGPLQRDRAVTEQAAREYRFGADELRLSQALFWPPPGRDEVIAARGPQPS